MSVLCEYTTVLALLLIYHFCTLTLRLICIAAEELSKKAKDRYSAVLVCTCFFIYVLACACVCLKRNVYVFNIEYMSVLKNNFLSI